MINLSFAVNQEAQMDMEQLLAKFALDPALPFADRVMAALKTEHWPFDDNSVGSVSLDFVLEDLDDHSLLHVISEINRICCDGALVWIKAHHVSACASKNIHSLHAFNVPKLQAFNAKNRAAHPDLVKANFSAEALQEHKLEINWEVLDSTAQLNLSKIDSLPQDIPQDIPQAQILGFLDQHPEYMEYLCLGLAVYKEDKSFFGMVKLPNVPKFLMSLYPLDSSQFVSRLIRTSNCFEVEETVLVLSILEKIAKSRAAQGINEPIKLANIGANLGWYALVCAKKYPFVHVDAFEPTPDTVAKLRQNTQINSLEDRVKIYPIALSDSKATCDLFVDGNNAGSNSLHQATGDAHQITKVIQIETDSMDNIYLEQPMSTWPSVIVMDVEGHEQKVLDGAAKMFAHQEQKKVWRPVIFAEFSPSLMVLRGECTYYKDLVQNFGYKLYVIAHGQKDLLQPVTIDEIASHYERLKENNPGDAHFDLVLIPS